MSKRQRGPTAVNNFEPTLSILIAAYNEEKVIEERINNIASMNYDLNKIEVFVGSDLSTDRTNEILTEAGKKYPWLNVYISETRKGKAGILNDLMTKVKNEILVFTDANTEFHTDALRNLVKDFVDENVGGVCGRLILVDSDSSRREGVEESKYWKYETIIKKAEGKLGIQISANGGIFAIRRNLYENIPTKKAVTDDLFISLSVVAKGFKFTYREDALGFEDVGTDVEEEFNRKVRFSATNFQTLIYFKNLLFSKNILLAYAFWSHKVTRWFLPALLVLIFLLSWYLSGEIYLLQKIFLLQIAFYMLAFCGYLLSLIKVRITVFSLPYFFIISNIAVVKGFIKYLRREHSVIWNPTER